MLFILSWVVQFCSLICIHDYHKQVMKETKFAIKVPLSISSQLMLCFAVSFKICIHDYHKKSWKKQFSSQVNYQLKVLLFFILYLENTGGEHYISCLHNTISISIFSIKYIETSIPKFPGFSHSVCCLKLVAEVKDIEIHLR